VPTTQADDVFNLGVLMDNETAPTGVFSKGSFSINGGWITSSLPVATEPVKQGGGFFNLDIQDFLSVSNVYFTNAKTMLKYTANTNTMAFDNCVEYGVLDNLLTNKTDNKVQIRNCKNSSNAIYRDTTRGFKFGSLESGKGYTVKGEYGYGDGELSFSSESGLSPLKLDSKGNVNIQNQNADSTKASNVLLINKSTPVFSGGVLTNSVALYTKLSSDSIPLLHLRSGSATDFEDYDYIVSSIISRASTGFSTLKGKVDGMQVYNRTLKKPLWWDATTSTWVDATGTTVTP
jgi:hypothetical protein